MKKISLVETGEERVIQLGRLDKGGIIILSRKNIMNSKAFGIQS